MKNPILTAQRWLRQAEYDLAQARKSLADGAFAYAAFFSEQSAQKSLKAFLFKSGKRTVPIHSIAELAREAGTIEPSFAALVERGTRLDRHYLASRYPDALPEPAVPFESYLKEEAEESVRIAEEIFKEVARFVA